MKEYIHRENLALFKKRLDEAQTDAERKVLQRLLAEEKAKESSTKDNVPSHVDRKGAPGPLTPY